MKLHGNARTVSKWFTCYRAESEDGLLERSSAPRSLPHRTSEERVQAIAALRGLQMTAAEIAECLRMPLSMVSAVVTRSGPGKRSRSEPPEPVNRYERKRPDELLHIDVRKLGRIGRPAIASTATGAHDRKGDRPPPLDFHPSLMTACTRTPRSANQVTPRWMKAIAQTAVKSWSSSA